MTGKRPSITGAFFSMLGLGAVAVAIVAIAVGFAASSAQRIDEAARDAAAVDLLEQRQAVAALLAAEQASAVLGQIDGGEPMVSAPFTAQRETALDNAVNIARGVADRGVSVGDEARRWLASLDTVTEPTSVADGFERLVAYNAMTEVVCCAGIIAADEHHTETLRRLETAALLPTSLWDNFYVAVAAGGRTRPPLPTQVDRFLEHVGTPGRLPPETALPSNTLGDDGMTTLASLGVSRETINTVLASGPIATIDQIVLNASGRSPDAVTIAAAFVAADAASRSLNDLFTSALEKTRVGLIDEINTAEQTRLVTNVVTPILLLVLIGIGAVVYRSVRAREKAMQRERHLLDSRNRFMRMVSHELRTPATAISGFSQMLSNEWTTLTEAEITEFLSIVDRQSTHLSLIVDDLLTLSHLETGRLRLQLSTVNLAAKATDAITMVDARYGIEVANSIDPDLVLIADPDRLVQIIRNLVENAAKYGKTGVEVTAAVVGGQCEIIVSDTGPGVPPDVAERIFRFWDRGGRDGDQIRGYGMGLAIARHLARAMVGDLRYRPHEPMGSEFVLTLPVGPTSPPQTIAAEPTQPETVVN